MKKLYDPMRDDIAFSVWMKPGLKEKIDQFSDKNDMKLRDMAEYSFQLLMAMPPDLLARLVQAKQAGQDLSNTAQEIWNR